MDSATFSARATFTSGWNPMTSLSLGITLIQKTLFALIRQKIFVPAIIHTL
jgi:hypothetical protein